MENIDSQLQTDPNKKPQDSNPTEVSKVTPIGVARNSSPPPTSNEREETVAVSRYHEFTSVELLKISFPALKESIAPWLKAKPMQPQPIKWLVHALLLLPTITLLGIAITYRKDLTQTQYDLSLILCSTLIGLFLTESWGDFKRFRDQTERWQESKGKDPLDECISALKEKCPEKLGKNNVNVNGNKTPKDC